MLDALPIFEEDNLHEDTLNEKISKNSSAKSNDNATDQMRLSIESDSISGTSESVEISYSALENNFKTNNAIFSQDKILNLI